MGKQKPVNNEMKQMFMNEAVTLRRELLQRLLSPARNIDTECQYPVDLTITEYKEFFDRHGLAKRVVEVWPEECWKLLPEIYEVEDKEDTEFEKAVKDLFEQLSVWYYLSRADVLSGIGQFGVMLLGLGDGGALDNPAPGINARGEKEGQAENTLLFLQTFDQSVVTIKESEKDITNPRYGFPTQYEIKFEGTNTVDQKIVHWSRIIHLVDNRTTSDVLGIPRMKPVYNNLLDVKKISGGSGEMFWKGGFPGYSFELTPEAEKAGAVIDEESMKEQLFLWGQGLQRWLMLTGVSAKSLQPQASNPSGHLEWHIRLIAMALGIPYRIFMGTEEGKLAGVQDKKVHNSRITRRRESYLTPLVIRPFFDRLIALGCLPEPNGYQIKWPDLESPTELDIADIAAKRTEAFAKYVTGGVDALFPPRSYLTSVHRMSEAEVDMVEAERENYQSEMSGVEEEEGKSREE
jgi:hypothetical protein